MEEVIVRCHNVKNKSYQLVISSNEDVAAESLTYFTGKNIEDCERQEIV